MLAAWASNDYQSISEMRRSFRFSAQVLAGNGGAAERLELLDQIGGALADSSPADGAADKERLCAYLGLLQHIGASRC